jgi:hypothetical protein
MPLCTHAAAAAAVVMLRNIFIIDLYCHDNALVLMMMMMRVSLMV